MSTCSSTRVLTPGEGYRVWAASYDRDSNPMLSLEQRILERMLPPLVGLDVVDLGCGTGRWLAWARKERARSLVGVDLSPEMLGQARATLGKRARLICSDYKHACLAKASADVVFGNFVLSYLQEPDQFLLVVHYVLRPGGLLILTDVHPQTAAALNWRRGVRVQNEFQQIRTFDRSIAHTVELCRDANFELTVGIEPQFGEPERLIFDENGKREYFDDINTYPAIYLLQLKTAKNQQKPQKRLQSASKSATVHSVLGGRLALGPADTLTADIRINASRIEAMHTLSTLATPQRARDGVDLGGYLVFPGFINAHDHLEFALFPRLGRGSYANFLEWADDIHRLDAPKIARHRNVPKNVRLWWGAIRNLLCGVTTVCHHNPYDPDVFRDDFAVRVLRDFEWAHSLALDPKAVVKKKAARKGLPFLLHLAEGIDQRSAEEILQLQRSGALDAETVVIHGIGLGPKGTALLQRNGAGLIWCPSSNLFLFGRTISAEEIENYANVALGSDSPLTAQGDLLDEVHCAHHAMNAKPRVLYEYITRQAARLLRLRNGEGSFRVNGFADLVAVRDTGRTPAETLVGLSYEDVEFVLLGGRVQLASTEIKDQLSANLCQGLQPLCIENTLRWIRAPLDWLFRETSAYLGGEIHLGGKRVRFGY